MEKSRNVMRYLDDFPGVVCIVSRDEEEKILAVNQELLRIFACSTEEEFMEFTHGHFRGLMAEEDYHSVAEMFGSLDREKNYNFYGFPSRTRDGRFIRIEGIFGPAEDMPLGPIWTLGLVRSDVRHLALERDLDTGLLGRHTFLEEAMKLRQKDEADGTYGQRAHIYLNLVHFSAYNASYGTKAGNRLLKGIGKILRRCFPKSLIGHVAADNFLILSPREGARKVLEKAVHEINGFIGNEAIRCKAGIVLFDKDQTPLLMMQRMDWQGPFDLAKLAADSIRDDSRRSVVLYTENMGREMVDRSFVLRNFEGALEKGHIHVYYQPVMRALSGKICGMEALARWKDPEKGMIYPNVFIPVLENMRLIHHLDCYVIEEAAKLYCRLKEEKKPIIPVSVNLSRVDFDVMKPFNFMERMVSQYQVPRWFFRIEVTESALTLNGEALKKELSRFRKAGYQLWLDDFGSGYSSLNVLKEFHFDELKIDMAFLQNFNEDSRKIIRSIILMAKNLSIHTLAEGAETKEQVDFLKESVCEKIQGYFYGRPMPREEIEKGLKEGTYIPERPREAVVMDRVGLVNILTDKPVGLFLDTKDELTILSRNEELQGETETVYGDDFIFFKGNRISHNDGIYPGSRPSSEEAGQAASGSPSLPHGTAPC